MRWEDPLLEMVQMREMYGPSEARICKAAVRDLPARAPKPEGVGGDEVERLQARFLLLAQAKIGGKQRHMEGLLAAIGACVRESTIPFWRDALAPAQPRDTFAVRRRDHAVAALALLARLGKTAGLEELRTVLAHPSPLTRASAARCLALATRDKEGRLPPGTIADLSKVASDAAFEARFLARAALCAAGEEVPFDAPGAVYRLEVALWEVTRTIEVLADTELYELADAIIGAFDWDADHLWEFTFAQKDRRFTVSDDEELGPGDLALGQLGLRVGQSFEFFFDFGDNHHFLVKVGAIGARTAQAKYPRVTAKKGKVAQYGGDDW